jgi:hypothetical protein
MQQKLSIIVLNFASGMTTEDSTGRERGLMGGGGGGNNKGNDMVPGHGQTESIGNLTGF